MHIGFDLDGIFVDKPPFMPKWLIEKLYKGKDNAILEYRIPGEFEQTIRRFSHFPLFRPAIQKNIILLRKIAENKKNDLFIISSRFNFLKDVTVHIEKEYEFPKIFKKMFFNDANEQPHVFKNRLIRELKIDRFVDDDLSLLKFLSRENPHIKFYWLNNKENEFLANNLLAITELTSIME